MEFHLAFEGCGQFICGDCSTSQGFEPFEHLDPNCCSKIVGNLKRNAAMSLPRAAAAGAFPISVHTFSDGRSLRVV